MTSYANQASTNAPGKVLIIGAGAAGLMAAYTLKQHQVDFQILEADNRFGGRIKRLTGFADFPIDSGAEWIHTDPDILGKLSGVSDLEKHLETIVYNPKTISVWAHEKLKKRDFVSHFYSEYKFKSSTWYGFFEKYIAPSIADHLQLNQVVKHIDYSGNKVVVTTNNGATYQADKVIATAPLTILQNGDIQFTPALQDARQTALNKVNMPGGLKVFMEFSERFYPDFTVPDGIVSFLWYSGTGMKAWYDVAYGKDTGMNIFGLFAVGKPAEAYVDQDNESLIPFILSELDEMFEGKASRYFQKAHVQNWSKEPYIAGSYSHYESYDLQNILAEPLDEKVYFAGEAYAEDASTVHGAGRSGVAVAKEILGL